MQSGAYLCSTENIDISFKVPKFTAGLFGGEGFIMQKISGDGICFANAGGTIKEINLNNSEIIVDTGSLVAFEDTLNYDIQVVKGFKNILFGGEGIFLTRIAGTGKVYLQSMPLARLTNKLLKTLQSRLTKENGQASFDIFDDS
jgi:uncharacterized protein (AIM24 family)